MKYKLLLILVITVLISCSRNTNEEAETYFNSGKSKAALKNYRGAIEDFSKAIELDSTYAAAYYYRGDARELIPMAEVDSAIATNPKSAEAYFMRGNAKAYLQVVIINVPGVNETEVFSLNTEYDRMTDLMTESGDLELGYEETEFQKLHRYAMRDFSKARELDSTFEEAYNNRGIGEANRPDYRGAIEDYTKAIELDPKYTDAFHCRGFAKYEMKDYRGAIEDYNEAQQVDISRFGATMEDFNQAIELDPKFAAAYWGRGQAKASDFPPDIEGAKADYDKARELDPKYANMVTALDNQEAEQAAKNRYFQEQQLEMYDSDVKNNPQDGEAYAGRALAKSDLGDIRGAIEDYIKGYELGVEDNWVSMEEYSHEIELDPKFAAAWFGRGFMKSRDEVDYKGAIEDFDKAIELDPQFAFAYYHRGLAKVALEQKESGCIDLRKTGELGYKKAFEEIKKYCNQ